jgi:undecaprenyl diphosphate synthase
VEAIDSALYEPNLPPVDVLVRTSGETRVSNFLLWQAHGAAISFASAAWPDYSSDDLRAAVDLALTSRDQHR